MVEAAVKCPHCQSEAIVKYGKTSNGKEQFRCPQRAECGRTFVRRYAYPGCWPTVKQQIVDMTLNGRGLRAIARVLHVGANPVLREVKKSGRAVSGQHKRRGGLWSGGAHGRRALRRSRGGGRNVEFRATQSAATLALACHCSVEWRGVGVGLRESCGYSLCGVAAVAQALGPGALLHGWGWSL